VKRQTEAVVAFFSFVFCGVIAGAAWCCAPAVKVPVEIERITIVGRSDAATCDPRPITIGVDLSHCEWVPTDDAGGFHCIGARPYTGDQ